LSEKKTTDITALLDQHATNGTTHCATCREPFASLLSSIIDNVIKTRRRVTVRQIWSCLVAEEDYPLTEGALAKHLVRHEPRYGKINLGHRGPIE